MVRLLLLEDNPGDSRLVRAKLADAAPLGFAITHAHRLADALACLESGDFDVILSDLSLPDSDRLCTVQALVAHAPTLPLVVLTGSNDDALGDQAILQGAQDYLLKNDASGALIARTLRYAMERKRLELALRQANAMLEVKVNERTTELAHSLGGAQALVQDKVALLHEVHHRVKNNLQVITSLLRLEARRSGQNETRTVLADMQGRIHAMALLHESLYRSGTFASVDLGHYIKQIATMAFRAQTGQNAAVELELLLANVSVSLDQATPCGLLVNELVANCFKHGFPAGCSGKIRIELQAMPDQPAASAAQAESAQWCLRVSDTGIGLPDDFEARRGQSLGLQLVLDLTRQLGGTLAIGAGPQAVFTVTFAVRADKTTMPQLP